ncbi:CBS domain-containing protein [[Kitasatospora] papulosa]
MTHGGFRHLVVLDGDGQFVVVSVRVFIRCWAPARRQAAGVAL